MEIIGFELFSEFNSFYPKLILVCIILFILITSISIKFNFSENAYWVTILITLIIILSVSMYHQKSKLFFTNYLLHKWKQSNHKR